MPPSTEPDPAIRLPVATEVIVGSVDDRTARGVAAAIGRLVGDGAVRPGERLPTVRALAAALAVSPTTVSEAWQHLGRAGLIERRGRSGTFVARAAPPAGPRRFRRMAAVAEHFRLDLSTGTPDPALLPDLGPSLARVGRSGLTTSYLDLPVLPELEAVLRKRLPFEPEALTVVDGALDGVDRVLTSVVRLGGRVLVENPTFPPTLDLLELLGAEVIPLTLDEQGVVPSSLQRALAERPVALFLQPRAQNPTGISMTSGRARRLATLLAGTDTIVVEDDHSGDIAGAADVSLARWLPERTVHITSFSKSHGPDLRLASVTGPSRLIQPVADRRMLGPGWSSRLLQAVLADLLTDPDTVGRVEAASTAYAARRKALTDALDRRGIGWTGADGINLWVETPDEQRTLVTLAAMGIAVAPGSPFMVTPDGVGHVRLTTSRLSDGHDDLADRVAVAVGTRPAQSARR
jgi:DNA-binding transcriptional MocR family regulator